jgi:hypothetical protein
MSYADARPIFEGLKPELIPAELRMRTPAELERMWPEWVARRDADIRSRVERGDEDSVTTFLLFGVTFTTQPRYSFVPLASTATAGSGIEERVLRDAVVRARIADLVTAIATPRQNERLLFARRVLERRGVNPDTDAGRRMATRFLEDAVRTMVREYDAYFRDPDVGATLFRTRGLSSDTSIYAAFAIDRTLEDLKAQGLLKAATVRRVAIVGPGLDFTDKQEGVDFYPVQTIQPFTVIDSLHRLQLAAGSGMTVTTFDLSGRINDHLEAARRNAAQGRPYTLQLPRDMKQAWEPALIGYWEALGSRIGTSATPIAPPPTLTNIRMRAVAVRPDVVSTITPEDANIVLQRPEPLGDDGRFDLVIATNILIYYDVFEQSLALANISRLLRPGGLLLTNTPLFELPGIPMRALGGTKVTYMTNATDGVVWYQRDPR